MRPAATLPAAVAELAALQHGNLHADDLQTLGVSDGLLRGLERRGVITEVLPSTWHCSGSPATWESEADAVPVELDGMRVHGPAAAARKDRRRDNRLRALQLPPLRYTYLDLLEETDRVLGEVTNALQAAGCGHLVGAPLADPVPLPPLPGARRR